LADDSIIYRKITTDKDMEKLQIDLNRLVENVIISPAKARHFCFPRA
jgi:hypothetical protein